MIKIRPSAERGHFDLDWLNTYHSFSFGEYYDPQHMGHGVLRVINDDTVAPGAGFPKHNHHDMEIITYVISGALEHKDSMGNGSIIKAGDVQYMSAGTGVAHSEFNPSDSTPVRLLQIWILPTKQGLQPRYNQISVDRNEKINQWYCVASANGSEKSMEISAAASMYACILQANKSLQKKLANKKAWLQIISGQIQIGDNTLQQGDGVALDEEPDLQIKALQDTELLLIEC